MASQQRSDDDDMPLLGGSESINRSKSSRQELIKATAAEFLAVVLFVFVGVTAVQNNKDATDVVGVALAHGFMIFVLISITGHVRYVRNTVRSLVQLLFSLFLHTANMHAHTHTHTSRAPGIPGRGHVKGT